LKNRQLQEKYYWFANLSFLAMPTTLMIS